MQHGGGGWSANVFFAFSAKSVTEKKQRSVDCAEADKKTVQAQRNEGRGFLAAGDCPEELHVIYEQAKPDLLFCNAMLKNNWITN